MRNRVVIYHRLTAKTLLNRLQYIIFSAPADYLFPGKSVWRRYETAVSFVFHWLAVVYEIMKAWMRFKEVLLRKFSRALAPPCGQGTLCSFMFKRFGGYWNMLYFCMEEQNHTNMPWSTRKKSKTNSLWICPLVSKKDFSEITATLPLPLYIKGFWGGSWWQ